MRLSWFKRTPRIQSWKSSQQKHYVNNVKNSGHHLLDLIDKILDISKIEAGKMEYEPERVSVKKLIDEVGNVMHPQALNKKLGLKVNRDEQIGDVYADKNKLKEIIYNLTSNAIKFTPKGGNIFLDAKDMGDYVQFAVEDEGIGIPEEKQDELFKPFTQLESSANRRYEGTGLGLALVSY